MWTERQRRIIALRKGGTDRAGIASELGCSVATVARELARMRRIVELPADLMTIDHRRAVGVLIEAEAAGRRDPDYSIIKSDGAFAMEVYKSLDDDGRALVRKPSLKALADSIHRSKSTAHRVMLKMRRAAGQLPPADKVRDELRMARNALGRARRLLAEDGWKASDAAWQELDQLIDEADEVNRRAEDPNYSPAQAALDALAEVEAARRGGG